MEAKNETTCEWCGSDLEMVDATYCDDCAFGPIEEPEEPVVTPLTMKERFLLRLRYAAEVMVGVLKHNAVWYLAGLIDGLILHLLMR
jgi:hypothetical protein